MTERHGEEHFIHRIEAFSDIVIGFTLAQVGAALVLPHHTRDLLSDWGWLFTFSWTFAVVCAMWLMHNRVFRTVFAPTVWSLVTNFALLAAIVILLYFAEVMAHATSQSDALVAQRLYNAALAIAYGLVALLTLLGARARRETLDPERLAYARASALLVGSAALFVLVVDAFSMTGVGNPWQPVYLGFSIPLGFAVGRVVLRVVRRMP